MGCNDYSCRAIVFPRSGSKISSACAVTNSNKFSGEMNHCGGKKYLEWKWKCNHWGLKVVWLQETHLQKGASGGKVDAKVLANSTCADPT